LNLFIGIRGIQLKKTVFTSLNKRSAFSIARTVLSQVGASKLFAIAVISASCLVITSAIAV
jgi:hypothetical protein